MNANRSFSRYLFRPLLAIALVVISGIANAQEEVKGDPPVAPEAPSTVTQVQEETEMDLPGQFDKNFGMQPGSKLEKSLKPLSKIDMDGDMNYDGVIDNDDSNDNGPRESVPPGLQIGTGELTKLVVRYKTYEKDFPGELYVQISVSGINRLSMNGKYASEREELESVGGIRVWAEKEKKTLLLDSSDPVKRSYEWKLDKVKFKRGLPGDFPRIVYVEGVDISKEFEGDVRLMISSSHSLSEGENRQPSGVYRTAFDHILFTILEAPVQKEFVNDNVQGVWPNSGGGNAQATAAQ